MPWWKDKVDGWPNRGIGSFFEESKRHYLTGDVEAAIEILEWGKRYSLELGSGGAVAELEKMIQMLRNA